MRPALAALALALAGCASAPAPEPAADLADPWPIPPAKVYSLPADDPSHRPVRDLHRIVHELESLSTPLAAYPPDISSDAEREHLYAEWCELVLDTRALPDAAYPDGESYHAIHAELYRLGYNLGVSGAARLAEENISYCLGYDVVSDPCHRTRVALYLSERSTSDRLMLAEASLDTLRATGERPDETVEAGYVALRALSLDEPGTLAAIDHYLELFPEGESADVFRKLRDEWEP